MTIWFILFVVLLIIEALTVNLVCIWFALGALISGVVAFFTDNISIQLLVFLLVSFSALVFTKNIVKKFKTSGDHRLNLDGVVGKYGIVTEDILPLQVGEIKVAGKKWSAICNDPIYKDSEVEVLAIDGVKLCVKKRSEN